jgi:hypothetical protein
MTRPVRPTTCVTAGRSGTPRARPRGRGGPGPRRGAAAPPVPRPGAAQHSDSGRRHTVMTTLIVLVIVALIAGLAIYRQPAHPGRHQPRRMRGQRPADQHGRRPDRPRRGAHQPVVGHRLRGAPTALRVRGAHRGEGIAERGAPSPRGTGIRAAALPATRSGRVHPPRLTSTFPNRGDVILPINLEKCV